MCDCDCELSKYERWGRVRAEALGEAATSVQDGGVQYVTAMAEAAVRNGGALAALAYAQVVIAGHLRDLAEKATA